MPDIINLLPDSIANQIAAGEVVQRPASVVKELMENSIDAGATKITVVVRDGGKEEIQVIDNGQGMSMTDARLCFERHATSKIRETSDLESIATMGFRGEALASIAAVSEITLLTRRAEDEVGTKITVKGSQVVEHAPSAAEIGANFSVRNLFFNVPARRRFLKDRSTEIKHIIAELQRVALAHEEIAFELIHDNATVYRIDRELRAQRITSLFGNSKLRALIPLNLEMDDIEIRGFLGKPESAKKRGAEQFFFVNGRYMRHPYLSKAVSNAYEKLIPSNERPLFFIFFSIDPSRIDINIHPQKTEIKFEEERMIWQILYSCVRNALGELQSAPVIPDEDSILSQLEVPRQSDLPQYNPFDVHGAPVPRHRMPKAEGPIKQEQPGQQSVKLSELQLSSKNELEAQIQIVTPHLFDLHIGPVQLYNSFILVSEGPNLLVIDQHRAHARIIYTALKRQPQGANSAQLLVPARVKLTPAQAIGIDAFLSDARELGLLAKLEEKNGEKIVVLYAMPNQMNVSDHEEFLADLIEEYESEDGDLQKTLREKELMAMAYAGAVKRGVSLSYEAMRTFQQRLFLCEEPALDPRGNPTIYMIDEANLRSMLHIAPRKK